MKVNDWGIEEKKIKKEERRTKEDFNATKRMYIYLWRELEECSHVHSEQEALENEERESNKILIAVGC